MRVRRAIGVGALPGLGISGAMGFTRHTALALALLVCGCAGVRDASTMAAGGDGAAAARLPADAVATTVFGAYLSGRVAQEEHDYPAALAFYQDALAHAPGNFELLNRVFVLATTEGRFELARPLAERVLDIDPKAALPNLVAAIEDLKQGDAREGLDRARRIPNDGYYSLCGALVRAWLTLGADRNLAAATSELDGLGAEAPLQVLKTLHRAILADVAGDTKAAAEAYRVAIAGGPPPLRLVQLAGNFFERNEMRDEAAKLYRDYAATAHGEIGIVPRLSAADRPPRLVADARAGLAEAMFDLASLLSQAGSPDVAVLNVRLALDLRADFPLAELVLGDALEAENRPKAALQVYRGIDRASPLAWAARLREAEIADLLGDTNGAQAALHAMSEERPDQAEAPLALGAIFREHNDFTAARNAYTEGLRRLGPDPAARFWSIYYSRGIAEEQGGDWPAAEADLRQALAMSPDNADVMNYLGYALVERNQKLPEAVRLIKRAVELQPENGYIVDSLGWAYFRTGQTADAERTLEKAVELKPGDAEINDHLGDAYWQGGRRDEARLQWRRALSLKPEAGVAKKIEAKLDRPPAEPRRMKTARQPN